MPELDAATERGMRSRALANLLRMGHCAPSVMQTLLDVSETEAEWLVKLVGGLPGGIGNTGEECGGVTAPLVLLGLRHAHEVKRVRLPLIVYQGHDLLRRFAACEGTVSCREIRGDARVPLRCIAVVRRAPGLFARALGSDSSGVLSPEQEEAYARLHAHWVEQNLHCAHAVFRQLGGARFESEDLGHASSGFMGGTVFAGMTCSAFTAGVMALGLAMGEIENSRLRVARMIGMMAVGGEAFADDVNAFNKSMNLGHELSRWFAGAFGSTRCRAVTACDFSTQEGVQHYVESGGTARCRAIAESVARRVQGMIGCA